MKKILSILLALVLVLSFSLTTATSVVADVHDVSVSVAPNTTSTVAEYDIVFNITSTLQIGATISIEFPTGTTVPTTYATGVVTVKGEDISSGDISVAGQVVTITLPLGIGAPGEVTVVFNVTAGITNPAIDDDYTLKVKTSKEPNWVTSAPYTIRLSDYSTYKFVYQPEPEETMIWRDEPAAVNVTLQTDVEGLAGYDEVLITFNVTEQPVGSGVTFNVSCFDVWHTYVGHGQCPDSGNFSVTADYVKLFPFRLTFNMVGVYAIKFALHNLNPVGVIEEDEISFAVTGVSVEVELNKGWNLMSLPIVPDDSDVEELLASIEDDFISVHHYDPLEPAPHWLIYAPPDHTSLTDMEDGKAYWINMSAAANLTVVGQAVAPPGYGPPPPSYSVVEGWNMVGFRSMYDMVSDVYLDGTDWVRIYGFDVDLGGWFSLTDTQNMTTGLGYWVAFAEPGTIYP